MISSPPTPTAEQATALFQALEERFPHKTLGDDKWYLVAISALVGSAPSFCANLYSHLIAQPRYATPATRQALVRRLREALVKDVCVLGVCKPLDAIMEIHKIEREEDKDYSCSREHWQSGPENSARGQQWLAQIYTKQLGQTLNPMGAHRDFEWISREITYGLYLSDHSILNGVETELVVLSGIMIQNLPPMTAWHLRGTRRVGVSSADVELVQQCIEMVAEFASVPVDRVCRVGDIEHEV